MQLNKYDGMNDEYTEKYIDEYNDEYTDEYADEYNAKYDDEYNDEYIVPLAQLFPNPSIYMTDGHITIMITGQPKPNNYHFVQIIYK